MTLSPFRQALALVAAILLSHAALPHASSAHEITPVIATLVASDENRFTLILSLNLEAAMAGIGPEHDNTDNSAAAPEYDRLRALEPQALRARFDIFGAELAGQFEMLADGAPARLQIERVDIPPTGDLDLPRRSEVSLGVAVPPGAESFTWRMDGSLGDSVIRVRAAGSKDILQSEYVRAGETAGPFSLGRPEPQRWTTVFANYLQIGFVHIVPKGVDHILFVVGIFLFSTRLSSLLWQVTAFTLAHTVTLALGMAGVVSLPTSIVEPLIAASILYVAVENVFTDRLHRWRTVLVFCFGLLHGLGFAGVLGEVGLSASAFVTGLIAFNLGVELGQLAVIAACFALAGWAMRRPWYRWAVVVPASLAIAVIAVYWIAERVDLI